MRPYSVALVGGFELASALTTLTTCGLAMAVMDGRGSSDLTRCAALCMLSLLGAAEAAGLAGGCQACMPALPLLHRRAQQLAECYVCATHPASHPPKPHPCPPTHTPTWPHSLLCRSTVGAVMLSIQLVAFLCYVGGTWLTSMRALWAATGLRARLRLPPSPGDKFADTVLQVRLGWAADEPGCR